MAETPDAGLVRGAVESLIASPQLAPCPHLCRFLRYVVEETLAGRGGRLKEYPIGAEVLGRGDGFDPRLDPIVRVQARNLRARMARYYEGPGAGDEVTIELPRRTYVPVFAFRRSRRPASGGDLTPDSKKDAYRAADSRAMLSI